ncbi:MAG: DUF3574 domain-containing protein [Thermodesulfobacteriota bacterium]
MSHERRRRVSAVRLVVAMLLGGAVAAVAGEKPVLVPPPLCVAARVPETSAPALAGNTADDRFVGEVFARTELFFGSERDGRPEVSPEEFKHFLDAVVTPCFPDGLTLLTGKGQFRESGGEIVQETSFVLMLLYPQSLREQSDAKIEAIRTIYKDHFQQESVLRVDDPRAARVGF